MLFGSYQEFTALDGGATMIPVANAVAADLRTPVSAFLRIAAQEPNAFLLESVEGGEKVGRYTFLGARPYMVLRAHGSRVTLEQDGKKKQLEDSVFKVLDRLLRVHKPAQVARLPPFTAGAVGLFAQDAVLHLVKHTSLAKDDL